MADISTITGINGVTYNIKDSIARASIPFGKVDSTSTSTAFTATVEGITELYDGVAVMLENGVVTSASGFTININGLGAKPVYTNLAAATRDTTIFNAAYTMLFVYDSSRVSSGCWICYRGYDSNTNTIGYQLRTNSTVRNVSDTARYYKLYFTSADGLTWVPASVNSTNNATSARPVNQRPIDPFGPIVYTSATTNYTAGSNLTAATIWEQYNLSLGYSFNRTGAALALTVEKPVYVKCAPQSNGSAIMDADTPTVQALPTTKDGKIYIYLGLATAAGTIELVPNHPVYWHDGTGIRLWTGRKHVTSVDDTATSWDVVVYGSDGYTIRDSGIQLGDPVSVQSGDGSLLGSIIAVNEQVSNKQDTLVSGTSIKTINGESVLGSGNLVISGGGSPTAMTKQEVEDTVDENWTAFAITANYAISVTDDGTYGENVYTKITEAYKGETITYAYVAEGVSYEVQKQGGGTVPQTMVGSYETGGGGGPIPMPPTLYYVYEFIMPSDQVEIVMDI